MSGESKSLKRYRSESDNDGDGDLEEASPAKVARVLDDEPKAPLDAQESDAVPPPAPLTEADLAALRAFLRPWLSSKAEQLVDGSHDAFFLFNGYGNTSEDIPSALKDLSVVFLGGHVVIQASQGSVLSKSELWSLVEPLLDPTSIVLLKQKSIAYGYHDASTIVLRDPSGLGVPNLITVFEHGIKFQLHIMEGLDFGIHLDMGEGRRWLREHATSLRVCNLFSYSCGLGVAAIKGGAVVVDNVDSSASALALGQVNAELNGFKNDRNLRFTRMDVHKYIKIKLKKSSERFDLIIVDPSPPPKYLKSSEEKISKFYLPLVRKAVSLLAAQGGRVLVSCHAKDVSEDSFESSLIKELGLTLREKIPYPSRMGITRTKLFVFEKIQA